jgi:hypothetical protein
LGIVINLQLFVNTDCWFVVFENVGYRTTRELTILSPSETLQILDETYAKVTMKKTQVYQWYKSFRDGRASVNDDQRCGRPPTSTNENIERVSNVVRSDR